MKVYKFGGSSVGNADRIKSVSRIITNSITPGESLAVVFSAFQGVTDSIIKISQLAEAGSLQYRELFEGLKEKHFETIKLLFESNREGIEEIVNSYFREFENLIYGVFILHELTEKTKDRLLSYGEILSCTIITKYLQQEGSNAEFLDARKIIKTNNQFNRAKVNFEVTNKLIADKLVDSGKIYVVTGFIASTKNDETTTLGRGGSDYTASIIGAAIDTEEIVIWTDVDGIMTADPGKVNEVRTIRAVTYEEAIELSYFGAKVIHPPTMLPALAKKIKIRIKNTFNPSFKGTVIIERESSVKFNLKGISSIDNITVLRVRGGGMRGIERTTARIFDVLAAADISVLLITQGSSGNSISIAIYPEQAILAKELLEDEFRLELLQKELEEVILLPEHSIIAIVGEDMIDTPGVSGKVFQALGKNGINIVATAQGSSQLNISVVIRKNQLVKALNVLHDSLGLSNEKILNLFMVGPGLVGSALLERFNDSEDVLKSENNIKIKLIALANSKNMLFNPKGIDHKNWKKELESGGVPVMKEEFLQTMYDMNLSNSIFIDCTASNYLVNSYPEILAKSISIVTPNKIANTLGLDFYKLLKTNALKHNVQFRYSTNVGAGLPYIEQISDRRKCGDKITRIEAVVSGSLSYIFNTFSNGDGFYDTVKKAQELGFTEPDPRDDLGGIDAARKLLILLREAGYNYEMEDIKIESLVPEPARDKGVSVEQFWSILKEHQSEINARRDITLKNGNKMCYIASYKNDQPTVRIEILEKSHPFFGLEGSENIISIYTNVYDDIPLVIRGNGAGAKVTSAGVFADIVRIANYLG